MASFFERIKRSFARAGEDAALEVEEQNQTEEASDRGEDHEGEAEDGKESFGATPPREVHFDPGTAGGDRIASAAQFLSRRPTPRVSSAFFEPEKNDKLRLDLPRATIREDVMDPNSLAVTEEEVFSFVRHNRVQDLKPILMNGANVNNRDENGNTLLMVAAQNGCVKIVRLLLRKGAAVNVQNKAGHTALHYAMVYNYVEVQGLLLSQGADIRVESS